MNVYRQVCALTILVMGATACGEGASAPITSEMAFQIERQQIMSKMRDPEGAETNLMYWRQRYSSADQRLTQGVNGILELRIPGAGRTLLYQSKSDRVVKVVEYAPIR